MITRTLIVAAALLLSGFMSSSAQAQQVYSGGGQVVHSRLAPVLLHRAVPPFRGQHVYSRGGRR